MLGPLSEAFLAGDPRAEPFLRADFRTPSARASHVQRARERMAASGVPLAPGAVAVVTGQQVGLFLGPLYSVYKAATAIACARALERETGNRCVPVFWLQTEDHDFAEVDHCHLLSAARTVEKLTLSAAPPERVSVRHAVLGEEVNVLVARLPAPAQELFAPHYRVGARLVDAFAGVMRVLFGAHGLMLIDPSEHPRAAAPVHLRAVRDAGRIAERLEARSAALEAAGFAVQVSVRHGAPLSFFHPDGAEGPRYRLTPDFQLVGREGTPFTHEALLNAVEQTPERFSTSALLRPILQDTLLPTAAIVGGPGELNYFAQVGPLYEEYGIPMPMLVPRARFVLLDARSRALRQQLATPMVQERDAAQIERQLVEAAERALAAAPAELDDAVKRTRGTIARAASRFAGRLQRWQEMKDAVRLDRKRRLEAALSPSGEPQERVLSLASFPSAIAELVPKLLANIDPWKPELKELEV
jgi:bacillithiol biosynthesis cysteine-adding enzyme BshC